MGRKSKRVIKVGDPYKLNLTRLLKKRPDKNVSILKGTVSWSSGYKIKFILSIGKDGNWIILQYDLNFGLGKPFIFESKIELQKYSSNLNNGYHFYFVCPVSGRRARHLYKISGIALWMHREASKIRIYYPSQLSSKLYYATNRYFSLNNQVNGLKERGFKFHYRNKETKTKKRFDYLSARRNYYNYLRCRVMIYMHRKYFGSVLANQMEEELEGIDPYKYNTDFF